LLPKKLNNLEENNEKKTDERIFMINLVEVFDEDWSKIS
jgi:hypothetical protein